MNLKLTVRRPSSLLSVLFKADINEHQLADIVNLVRHPNDYQVVRRSTMGFRNPEGGANART